MKVKNEKDFDVLDPFTRRWIEKGKSVDLSKLSSPHRMALLRLVATKDLVEAPKTKKKKEV